MISSTIPTMNSKLNSNFIHHHLTFLEQNIRIKMHKKSKTSLSSQNNTHFVICFILKYTMCNEKFVRSE